MRRTTPSRFHMICVHAMLVAVTILPRAWGGDAAAKPAALEGAWHDLAGNDQARVARAAIVLGRSPADAVAFLRERCRPVKVDAKQVQRWLAELDAEESSPRAAAQEELEYLGKYVKSELQQAVKAVTSAEARKRIQQLLDRIAAEEKRANPPAAKPGMPAGGRRVSVSNINGQVQIVIDGVPLDLTPRVVAPVGPPPAWVRAVRAIGILEGLGTPAARHLLENIAGGEASALPTIEARAALARLGKR